MFVEHYVHSGRSNLGSEDQGQSVNVANTDVKWPKKYGNQIWIFL